MDPRPTTSQSIAPQPIAIAPWYGGLRVDRSELGTVVRLVLCLSAAGVPAGLLWLVLAPRRAYEVVDGGFRALEPQSEALIGADGWLTIVLGLLGVLAAGLVWRFERVRGVGIVLGLAAGMVAAAVVAWQVGEWLGTGASEVQRAQLGAIVVPPLQLRAFPVLVIGAFLATLSYLIVVCFIRRDDLQPHSPLLSSGWTEPPTAPAGPGPRAEPQARSVPGAGGATAPPTVPPSGPRPGVPADPRR